MVRAGGELLREIPDRAGRFLVPANLFCVMCPVLLDVCKRASIGFILVVHCRVVEVGFN